MAAVNDAKHRIVEELERTRGDLSGASVELGGQLNFQRRFSVVWQRHRWTWLSFVALFGWVLSRLPSRKKKIYIDKGGARVKRGTGLASMIVGQLWAVAWSVAKPVVTAYLTKKMTRER
jgi:hypothetical protein